MTLPVAPGRTIAITGQAVAVAILGQVGLRGAGRPPLRSGLCGVSARNVRTAAEAPRAGPREAGAPGGAAYGQGSLMHTTMGGSHEATAPLPSTSTAQVWGEGGFVSLAAAGDACERGSRPDLRVP